MSGSSDDNAWSRATADPLGDINNAFDIVKKQNINISICYGTPHLQEYLEIIERLKNIPGVHIDVGTPGHIDWDKIAETIEIHEKIDQIYNEYISFYVPDRGDERRYAIFKPKNNKPWYQQTNNKRKRHY